mmetsp:Transcript_13041/g.30858  ORF Transcript_13041/g.30858 Transcript_13041/m.30858 type:complete len:305 (-) Transcript_13041:1237-2151(-)
MALHIPNLSEGQRRLAGARQSLVSSNAGTGEGGEVGGGEAGGKVRDFGDREGREGPGDIIRGKSRSRSRNIRDSEGRLRSSATAVAAKFGETEEMKVLLLQHFEKGSQLFAAGWTVQRDCSLRDVDGQGPRVVREGGMRGLGDALEDEGDDAGRKARIAEPVRHGHDPNPCSNHVEFDGTEIEVDEAGDHSRKEGIVAGSHSKEDAGHESSRALLHLRKTGGARVDPVPQGGRAVVEQGKQGVASRLDPILGREAVEEPLEPANGRDKRGGHDERRVQEREEINAGGPIEGRKSTKRRRGARNA